MPFKSILYSTSEPSVFLHSNIVLWIACLKCLYCCPQPLLGGAKWLSFSDAHARTHTHAHISIPSVYFNPMAALRGIMRRWTIAYCSMKWNPETEKQRGDGQTRQGRHHSTAVICHHRLLRRGSGSSGKVTCRSEPCSLKLLSAPQALHTCTLSCSCVSPRGCRVHLWLPARSRWSDRAAGVEASYW